jgi:hypothetical protein
VKRAGLAKDVARVDQAEIFLGVPASISRIGINGAEGVASERVAVLWSIRGSVANGGQNFAQRSIFPANNQLWISTPGCVMRVPCEYLLLVGGWKSAVFKQRKSMKTSNLEKDADKEWRCLEQIQRVSL